MKRLFTLFVLSLLCASAESQKAFPGELSHWKMSGPGEFETSEEIATAKGGMGLWWFSKEKFSNASISLEFKLNNPTYNSGVFVRFPDPGDDPRVAVKQGYEIQISGSQVNDASTGAIYKLQAPVENPLKKNGEWNQMLIHTLKNEITVLLNGKLINIFKAEKNRGDKDGYFGIQNHDSGSPVQFRNITVTPHSEKTRLSDLISRSSQISYSFKRSLQKKTKKAWYDHADFGPAFIQTWGDFHENNYRPNAAIKGILLRPDFANRNLVTVFNTETMQLVTATNKGVSLDNTPFRGNHGTQNKILNQSNPYFNNANGPAWANAEDSFADNRKHLGHGNFEHMKFNGYYRHGHEIILDYEVNGTSILEKIITEGEAIRRVLQIQDHKGTYRTRLSTTPVEDSSTISESITIKTSAEGTIWEHTKKGEDVIAIDYHPGGEIKLIRDGILGLDSQTKGGPSIYPETFEVDAALDKGNGAFLVDQIPLPPQLNKSPYKNKIRLTDFDFFANSDSAALCTWDGDVWLISGLNEFKTITWKRFATGLFEPLGLKIINDVIHLNCRDGIWQIIDLNDDNEADHYKVFNYDIIITDNFHEFSFGLETDNEGNLYFSKASPVRPGGRNFEKILDHNGTILKLTPDGENLSVIASGLRAPGGIGVGPNGELTTGENEGTWQPCCKINYFTKEQRPVFLGTEQARQDIKKEFQEPLCYLPMNVDNSGGAQVWIPNEAQMGLAAGELLHLSYGQSAIYRVLPQQLKDGQMQGGVIKLPIKLSSSAQRAAFHNDGSMYVSGMRGWQTNAATEAGIQRVRHNEKTLLGLPEAMSVSGDKLTLRFDSELDEELATDPESFSIKRWKYIRGPQYGSGQFSIDNPDTAAEENALLQESKSHKKQDNVEVASVTLGDDGKTVTLTIPTLKPAQQMQIAYDLESTAGEVLIGTVYSTIHQN